MRGIAIALFLVSGASVRAEEPVHIDQEIRLLMVASVENCLGQERSEGIEECAEVFSSICGSETFKSEMKITDAQCAHFDALMWEWALRAEVSRQGNQALFDHRAFSRERSAECGFELEGEQALQALEPDTATCLKIETIERLKALMEVEGEAE